MNIWKRITSCVLCAGLLLAPVNGVPEKPAASITAHAATSGKCGELLTWTLDDAGTLTISGKGEMLFDGNYTTLHYAKNVPWLDSKSSIRTVRIGEGVTSIESYAFSYCTNLTSVTIPDSVTSILPEAFKNCTSLTTVMIPDSVTNIEYEVFDSCTNLTSINLPDGLNWISESLFSGCTSLTSMTIPDGAYRIGSYAFSGCTNLTAVTIPDSVQNIESYVFKDCNKLTIYGKVGSAAETYAKERNIPFKEGVAPSDPGSSSTYPTSGKCGDNVTWELDDSGTLTISGTGKMFSYDSAILDLLPPWYNQRGKIRKVVIQDGVTYIGSEAFWDCAGLASVTFPDSMTSISMYDFWGCSSLTSITVSAGNTEYTSVNGVLYSKDQKTLVVYPFGKKGAFTIPDSVTSIGRFAFWTCENLTSVTIPDGVTSIEVGAFEGCKNLTSVTIPDSVTSIGGSAFRLCTCLNSVTILNPKCEIYDDKSTFCNDHDSENYPFTGTIYGYEGSTAQTYAQKHGRKFVSIGGSPSTTTTTRIITTTTRPTTTTTRRTITTTQATTTTTQTTTTQTNPTSGKCGDNVTWKLDETGTLTISGTGEMTNYTYDSKSPFNDNAKIKNVVIKPGVTSIGEQAFRECKSMTSVIIPDSVRSIGGYAFLSCENLTTVTFGDGVTSIGEWGFKNCTSLTSVTIPDSVITIAGSTFYGCTNLTSVTIPDSVTSIGGSAFSGCTNLTSVTIPDSVTSIRWYAFNNCTSLTSVTILNPECEIYDERYTICNGDYSKNHFFIGTIYGYEGSTAQAYAKKYGRKFEVISSTPSTSTTEPAATTTPRPATTTSTTCPTTTTTQASTTTLTTTVAKATTTATTSTEVLTLPQDSIKLRAEKTYRIPQITDGLTYTALTPEIADVTANGLVMALANGTASIKITDSTGTSTVLTVDVVSADTSPYPLGNLNSDDAINAKDATMILIAAARIGTGGATGFTDEQSVSADVNGDGSINAKDATAVLRYAAAVGTGSAGKLTDYI